MLKRTCWAELLTALVASSPAIHAADEPWRENFWNPQPMEDDFVLPLPCGGSKAAKAAGSRDPCHSN